MIQPFHINVGTSEIENLKKRIARTRWPDEMKNVGWNYGTNPAYLHELCDYWQYEFDWKRQEAFLNGFSHFKTTINDFDIHFIHEKGKGDHSTPLLLVHGWPDSFIRFLKIIPLLTAADKDGHSFEVVVPSIPGFGFSSVKSDADVEPKKIASAFTTLMTERLGYKKFVAHGGDWGSFVTENIALYHPKSLLAIHLTDVPFAHGFQDVDEKTEAENAYFAASQHYQMTEGGYNMIQSTKPQTLAYGLTDSPAGMAAWLVEKFESLSDNNGNIEHCFSKDELLTNICIYWFTNSINSSSCIYYNTMKSIMDAKYNPLMKINPFDKTGDKEKVPAGFSIFKKGMIPPREYTERFFSTSYYALLPIGGHFAAMEQPELLAGEIRQFVSQIADRNPN